MRLHKDKNLKQVDRLKNKGNKTVPMYTNIILLVYMILNSKGLYNIGIHNLKW